MERLGLDTIIVGFVYNIVLCRKSVIGAEQTWDRANGQDLRLAGYILFPKTCYYIVLKTYLHMFSTEIQESNGVFGPGN